MLAEDILAQEFVPDFDRSSVDGYAVRSADTFGCSTAIPAIFPLQGAVEMGESAPALAANSCLYAVSYTHLDVYKRQALPSAVDPRLAWHT